MAVEVGEQIDRIVQLRSRQCVDQLDEVRAVRVLAQHVSQSEIAKQLHISQSAVSQRLKRAAAVAEAPAGFSGASPYEIAQRYAAGLISRERVIDELARWDYEPRHRTDGVDWLTPDDPGRTFEAVGAALDDGLLGDEVYDAILDAKDALSHTR